MVQKVKTAATVDESRWTEANANLLLTTLNSLWMEAKGNGMNPRGIGKERKTFLLSSFTCDFFVFFCFFFESELIGKLKKGTSFFFNKFVCSFFCVLFFSYIFISNLFLDLIKGYIGEHIAQQLVHLAYSENIEISVSAAKLLRSITVNSM